MTLLVVFNTRTKTRYTETLRAALENKTAPHKGEGQTAIEVLACRELKIPYVVLTRSDESRLEIVDRNVRLEELPSDTRVLPRTALEFLNQPLLARFSENLVIVMTADASIPVKGMFATLLAKHPVARPLVIEPLVCPGCPDRSFKKALMDVGMGEAIVAGMA